MRNNYYYSYEDREAPIPKLRTDRCWWKFLLLSLATLGFYEIFYFLYVTSDLEKVSLDRMRPKLMNYIFIFVLSYFTFSIISVIWHYHLAERIEVSLKERNIDYKFNTKTFWIWGFFGSFYIVGQYVYIHKLCTAMNLLCESYNEEKAKSVR